MPILRVARAHARVARAMASQRAYARWAAMARATIRPIVGCWELLLREQSSPKWETRCLGRR